jgi:serine/threonine protein kinase
MDCIQNGNIVSILLEFASYGNLFQYLDLKVGMPETLALRFFYQTSIGIKYLHNNNIMHRDLKPENLLLDEKLNIKICDLGYACYFEEENPRSTMCGTFYYYPPEMLEEQKHTLKVDIWCLGVILYELLHCKTPYFGLNLDDLHNSIKTRSIELREDLTDETKELLKRMLSVDPDQRLSIDDVLGHPAITNRIENFKEPVSEDDFKYLMNNYYEFKLRQIKTKTINEDINKLVNEKKVVQVRILNDNNESSLVAVPIPEGIFQTENNFVSLAEVISTCDTSIPRKRALSTDRLNQIHRLNRDTEIYPVKTWSSQHFMLDFLIKTAIQNREAIHPSQQIILLERSLDWKHAFYRVEKELGLSEHIRFIIYFSRVHQLFVVEAIEDEVEKGVFRKLLHKNFRNKSEQKLVELTNIPGFVFCQKYGLIAGARTLFSAILIADLSL